MPTYLVIVILIDREVLCLRLHEVSDQLWSCKGQRVHVLRCDAIYLCVIAIRKLISHLDVWTQRQQWISLCTPPAPPCTSAHIVPLPQTVPAETSLSVHVLVMGKNRSRGSSLLLTSITGTPIS